MIFERFGPPRRGQRTLRAIAVHGGPPIKATAAKGIRYGAPATVESRSPTNAPWLGRTACALHFRFIEDAADRPCF